MDLMEVVVDWINLSDYRLNVVTNACGGEMS
jgi:hypothetical protein